MNLLSLGGLPPFLGFLPKWLVIQALTDSNQILLITLLTVITLVALFFYIRLTYSAFTLNYYENNWNLYIQFNSNIINICFLLSFISTIGFIIIWILYFML